MTSTRVRGGALGGALVLALSAFVAPMALAAPAPDVLNEPITLDYGHIDAFNPVLNEDDSLQLALKEDVTGSHVLHTPDSVELFVKPSALKQVPAGYLPGLPADIYHLPLTQDANLIWPGWDTQGITSVFPGADTDIVVSDVDGPGQVFLWSQSPFGQPTSLIKGGGYTLPNVISQPYPAHTHANWAFTAPGTYKLTVRADVRASDGTSASSNTATYTFVVGERTKLSPEAPTQDGNTVTIPDQAWVSYLDAQGNVLGSGAQEITEDTVITAVPALGFDLTPDVESEWTFHYQEPVVQKLEITGVKEHYHQNTAIVLNAVADPAVEDATYQWFIQRRDQAEPVQVADQTGAELRITAEQALSGAQVTVNVLDKDGAIVTSAPAAVLTINDHGAAPLQKVTVSGLADHYHPDSTATLTAGVSPASVLDRYVWEIQKAGSSDWTPVQGVSGAEYSFPVTEDLNGAKVRAKLVYNDGTEYVASDPVALVVDDHHGEEPVETSLSVTGLATSYKVGDALSLTAVQDPATAEDHYHWFIKRSGDSDYSVISGALTASLQYTVAKGDGGAQIIARLYDHDHQLIAESTPVTLAVDEQTPTPDPKPSPDPKPTPGSGDQTPAAEKPQSGDQKKNDKGELPRTGSPIALGAAAAAGLTLLGAITVTASRKRLF